MQMPEPTRRDLRSFGLILGCGIALLFGLFFPWLADAAYPTWPWWFALASGAVGLTVPVALKPVYRVWMKLGHVLGWINTRIILGAVFYVIIAPIGLVLRVTGWDAMSRKLDPAVKSYRVASKVRSGEHLEKPY